MNRGSADEGASPQEEDKARMLFGSRLMVNLISLSYFSFIINLQLTQNKRKESENSTKN